MVVARIRPRLELSGEALTWNIMRGAKSGAIRPLSRAPSYSAPVRQRCGVSGSWRRIARIAYSRHDAKTAPQRPDHHDGRQGMRETDSNMETFDFGGIPVVLYCPNRRARNRGRTALTKEPETIRWLDAVRPESVLWDVGANVGIYSLYAAMKCQCRVVAFEPAAANFDVLNRNIEANALDSRVVAYCISIASTTTFDRLYLSNTEYGGALSNFGSAIDYQGNAFEPIFRQGSVSFSLDALIAAGLPFPQHIKVDVDGLEREIVASGTQLFADERLQSAMIELDTARPELVRAVVETMRSSGFIFANETDDHPKEFINAVFKRSRAAAHSQ
jgi:FkbM family methyltransferase